MTLRNWHLNFDGNELIDSYSAQLIWRSIVMSTMIRDAHACTACRLIY